MRLCSIASGSEGNCIYVGTKQTHLLVDAGISGKRVEQGLLELSVEMSLVSGILVTHEHSDHIQGIGVLARKYKVPVFATNGTIDAIRNSKYTCAIDGALFHPVQADMPFMVGGITVNPMSVSHDAAEPVAYRFDDGARRVAIITDLGMYDDYTVECLKKMDVLFLEANHDVHMLQAGSYPYPLKQRILGERGHLSNELAAKLLCELVHENLQSVMLGHLSRENNLAELAYETVRTEVAMSDTGRAAGDFPIWIAKRNANSEVVMV